MNVKMFLAEYAWKSNVAFPDHYDSVAPFSCLDMGYGIMCTNMSDGDSNNPANASDRRLTDPFLLLEDVIAQVDEYTLTSMYSLIWD